MTARRQLPNTTQVPNLYLDRLMSHLSGDEFKVLMYVNRRVLGFHLNHAPVSIRQIARGNGRVGRDGEAVEQGTGLSLEFIVKTVAFLVQAGVLIEVRPSFGGRAPHYDVATDASQIDWELIEQHGDERREAGNRRVAKARARLREQEQEKQTAAASPSSAGPVAQPSLIDAEADERSVVQNSAAAADADDLAVDRSVAQNTKRSVIQNSERSVAQNNSRSVTQNDDRDFSFGPTEQLLETKKEKEKEREETQSETVDPVLRNKWEQVLQLLEMQMPRATYASWVRPTRAIRLEEDLLLVRVENALARDWLDTRLHDLVTRSARDVLGMPVRVEFVAADHGVRVGGVWVRPGGARDDA